MATKNKSLKAISVLIALILIVGILPINVFAEVNTSFTPWDQVAGPDEENEKYAANGFEIRLLSNDGVEKIKKNYTIEELEDMSEKEVYHYTTGCPSGVAGIKAQGVLLEKILADAGIEFKEGMSLKLRVGDSSSENGYYRMGNFTYDYIMGQDRYYLPEFFNIIAENENLPEEERLGRAELYQKPEAWNNKVKVKPLLAITAYEHIIGNYGNDDDLTTLEQLKNSEMTRNATLRFSFGQAEEEDGSVSTAITRMQAAKWVFGIDIVEGKDEKPSVNAVDYSVRTYNEDNSEKGQTVEVKVDFSESVVVNENAANDFNLTIAGGSVLNPTVDKDGNDIPSARVLSVKQSEGNEKQITMTIKVNEEYASMIAQFNGNLKISAKDEKLTNITDKDGKPVVWSDIDTFIPTGITMNSKEYVKGTDTDVASVTKTIGSKSNVRGMVHIKALSNGEPILPNGGRFTTHAHNFISLKEEDYAKSIVNSFNSALETAELQDKYIAVWEEGSKDFTIKALNPKSGEILDVQMDEWTEVTDRSHLEKAINEGNSYKSEDYNNASFKALESAITEGQAIVANLLAKESQVKQVQIKIEQAIANLKLYAFDNYGVRKGVKLEENFKGDWDTHKTINDVALDKFWTVTFSSEVKDEKIDGIVIEKNGKSIPVKIETIESNKMKVSPIESYEKDSTYKLKVYLNNGKGYEKEFTTIK